ncbi:Crp/Fnr family transcriptional regulator [Flavobacterium selenitireducens]|uniref:Crp/Fnr family transcriptional regulator n=1 Tax=Flavobacterium selenitireducens TaxID=2722704 RepID=UPI00168BC6D2|nr:Crp/Fnr family transcriptional regulator [Flavobacterium selenitireducens]MBD3583807.1 Crp/Fnr family transcriptional regulator [Flavobacterium selenitireducens]
MNESQLFLKRHFEAVIDFTDAEAEYVVSHFKPGHFAKKEFVFRENDEVTHNFFIVSGLTKLFVADPEGNEHIVSFAMEDWWETDSLAFFTRTKAVTSMQCIENTTLFSLGYDHYLQLCSEMPKVEHFFHQKAIASHLAAQKRMLALTTLTAKKRYEQLLETRPALFQRLPKTLLASYLGVSRETLSRLVG